MKSVWSKRAVLISVAFHAALLVSLLFWYRPDPGPSSSDNETSPTSTPDPIVKTESKLLVESGDQDASKPLDVPEEQIRKSIESRISDASKVPDRVKLSSLDKNLKRLDAIADPQSVNQLTEKIASTMGLDSQAYQPKPNDAEKFSSNPAEASSSFDFDTAQLTDVTRSMGDDGQWIYESELLDRNGNVLTVPMTQSEGAKVYDVFAKLNQYPMAAGIYRSVVMPMLQKMTEAEQVAGVSARQGDQTPESKSDSDNSPR